MTEPVLPAGYAISFDPTAIDPAVVHRWLAESSYWAQGRTLDTVERSLANSIPLAVFAGQDLVGFARIVTDRSTFAWLCDVFVVEGHRGRGLGKALVAAAVGHPELTGIRRFVLATADAQGLYRQYGFEVLERPERWMIRRGPGR